MGIFRRLTDAVFGKTHLTTKEIVNELISVLVAHYKIVSKGGRGREVDSLFGKTLSTLERLKKGQVGAQDEGYLVAEATQLLEKYGETSNAIFYAVVRNPQYARLYSSSDIATLSVLYNRLLGLAKQLKP